MAAIKLLHFIDIRVDDHGLFVVIVDFTNRDVSVPKFRLLLRLF